MAWIFFVFCCGTCYLVLGRCRSPCHEFGRMRASPIPLPSSMCFVSLRYIPPLMALLYVALLYLCRLIRDCLRVASVPCYTWRL